MRRYFVEYSNPISDVEEISEEEYTAIRLSDTFVGSDTYGRLYIYDTDALTMHYIDKDGLYGMHGFPRGQVHLTVTFLGELDEMVQAAKETKERKGLISDKDK